MYKDQSFQNSPFVKFVIKFINIKDYSWISNCLFVECAWDHLSDSWISVHTSWHKSYQSSTLGDAWLVPPEHKCCDYPPLNCTWYWHWNPSLIIRCFISSHFVCVCVCVVLCTSLTFVLIISWYKYCSRTVNFLFSILFKWVITLV